MKTRKNKGITLIALVITIIVLLILAGISVNLIIGERGIFKMAQEAGRNYTNAASYEDDILDRVTSEAEDIINGLEKQNTQWSETYKETKKDNYTDKNGDKATIPEGFQVSTKEGETEILTGLVIRDAQDHNEFVWVPVNETLTYNYGRTSPSGEPMTGEIVEGASSARYTYIEDMPILQGDMTEEDSVIQYGGFYIGRYETGITGYGTNINTENYSETGTAYSNGVPVVKKGYQVWNYITKDKAKEIVEAMYSSNMSITTKLCSSYAWDTTAKFVKMNYPEGSLKANTRDTEFEYIDLEGNKKLKEKGVELLVPTGQTLPVNNIYDMVGNAADMTSEISLTSTSGTYEWGTVRGGYYTFTRDIRHRSWSSTQGYEWYQF